ncbi:MAG: NADH:ubiquinone reductase (Na(+)-transporting) subunit B [Gammaproteobacteria bacterium]|nr:NADH:ubiquinone reductase (Na(+)-transporting) subunit B [Gammaproteobacteria bacterium]
MGPQQRFDRLREKFTARGEHSISRALFTLFDRFIYSTTASTHTGPHIRDSANIQRLMNYFVLATLPCWIIGMWNLGHQTNLAMAQLELNVASGWRGWLLDYLGIGFDAQNILACFWHGLLYFLPIFFVALFVAAVWEAVFATLRRKPVDEGLLAIVWLYVLLLPATTPLYQVVLGITFGLVVGKAIYGGTGRYLVNPALLALAFHMFAYPALVFGEGAWVPVPGYDLPTALELAIKQGGVVALESANYSWEQLFFGSQPGPMGVTSVFGVLIGALILLVLGVASWRIMLGGVIGMVAAVLIFNGLGSAGNPINAIPWYWHMVLGGFVFGLVFLATDPVPAATTNVGRWIFGITVGLLTVVMRVTNPSHFEGVVFAILLASMFAPLMDFVVIELHIRKRRKRQRRLAGNSR